MIDPAVGGVGHRDPAAIGGDRDRLPRVVAPGRLKQAAEHDMAGVDHKQPPGRRRIGDVEPVAVGVDGARIDETELPAGHVLEPAGAAVEAAQSAAGLVEQPENVRTVDRDMARRDQPAEASRRVPEHREAAGQRSERQSIVVLADLEAALPVQPPLGAAAERHPQGIVRRHRRGRDEGGGAHAVAPSSALRTATVTASTRIRAPVGIATSWHCGISTESSVITSSGTRSTPSSSARR